LKKDFCDRGIFSLLWERKTTNYKYVQLITNGYIGTFGNYINMLYNINFTQMLYGFSMNLKDRRVDKILRNKESQKNQIFYSPILTWVIFWFILFCIAIPIVFFSWQLIWHYLGYYFFIILGVYFGIGYLIASKLNNSFVLDEENLIIVNPNFPWNKVQYFKFNDILKIEFKENKQYFLAIIFGIVERNYIEIFTKKGEFQFYCSGLSIDCFDENWTEKTLDDFKLELQKIGVKIEWYLD